MRTKSAPKFCSFDVFLFQKILVSQKKLANWLVLSSCSCLLGGQLFARLLVCQLFAAGAGGDELVVNFTNKATTCELGCPTECQLGCQRGEEEESIRKEGRKGGSWWVGNFLKIIGRIRMKKIINFILVGNRNIGSRQGYDNIISVGR